MDGGILSSGLGSIPYCMMWFCTYLDDLEYSITIRVFGLYVLFQTSERHDIGPQLSCRHSLTVNLTINIQEKSHKKKL